MIQSFEDAGKAGKAFVDTGLKSFANASKSLQALTAEAGEYSRRSFEAGSEAFGKLATARSLDKALEIQTDYARQAYESFVAQAARFSEAYAEMARDAYKPFESLVAKSK